MRCLYFVSKWPRQNYSAGHERIYSIIGSLINNNYEVNVLCSESDEQCNTDDIRQYPVNIVECPNHRFPKQQQSKMAIFDTYLTANSYSDELYNRSNKTLQILDLQDLHALREQRLRIFQKWSKEHPTMLTFKGSPMWTIGQNKQQKKAINKADLVITCSDFEYYNMQKVYPSANLCLATFLYPLNDFITQIKDRSYRPYEMRKNFVFVGNMAHQPNIDSVRLLIQHIWPMVRAKGSKQELHIYGSEFPKELFAAKASLKDKGIRLMGQLEHIEEVGKYIAMLAPLRFGAGIKGKIIDAWFEHTPVITTPIGSEGMFLQQTDESLSSNKSIYYSDKVELTPEQLESQNRIRNYYDLNEFGSQAKSLRFGGLWQNYSVEEFVEAILKISSDRRLWQQSRQTGADIVIKNHGQYMGVKSLLKSISTTEMKLKLLRERPDYKQQWSQPKKQRRLA